MNVDKHYSHLIICSQQPTWSIAEFFLFQQLAIDSASSQLVKCHVNCFGMSHKHPWLCISGINTWEVIKSPHVTTFGKNAGINYLELCRILSSARESASVNTSIVQSFRSSCRKHANFYKYRQAFGPYHLPEGGFICLFLDSKI